MSFLLRRGRAKTPAGPRLGRLPADGFVREVDVGDVRVVIADHNGSNAVDIISIEFDQGDYDFEGMDFQPGDVVLDLGAHVGAISMYLASKYPFLRVIAYEPVPLNFSYLRYNLARNGIKNVETVNLAVTSDGRDLELLQHPQSNTGGASSSFSRLDLPGHERPRSRSVTLNAIFDRHEIKELKLLKIDVEGAEHEVLKASHVLDRVQFLVGEFHENSYLRGQGFSIESLTDWCAQFIPAERLRITDCALPDY
jgi:FkbM family methyltransferase